MQKVKLTFKAIDLEKTLAEKKEVYKVETSNHIVASTKSYNNLIDELKAEGKIATNSEVSDLFIDKPATLKVITEFINGQIKDTDTAKYVINHIMKSLDGACIFKKPPVIRSKK